jgi:hypothetical protein
MSGTRRKSCQLASPELAGNHGVDSRSERVRDEEPGLAAYVYAIAFRTCLTLDPITKGRRRFERTLDPRRGFSQPGDKRVRRSDAEIGTADAGAPRNRMMFKRLRSIFPMHVLSPTTQLYPR